MKSPSFNSIAEPEPSEADVIEFCAAARDGRIHEVNKYLDRFGAKIIEGRDNGRDTALTWAAYHGYTGIINLLLDRGAAVDAPGMDDKSALAWAAQRDRREAMETLLSRGASLDTRDRNGRRPIEHAASNETRDFLRAWEEKRRREAEERRRAEERRIENEKKARFEERRHNLNRFKKPKL